MLKKAIVVVLALSQSGLCIPNAIANGKKCVTPTVTVTAGKKTTTVTQANTITATATTTATPGPIVELFAYNLPNCGVASVVSPGNAPNFQLSDLTPRNCVAIGENVSSFSYHVVPGLASASSCQLYFYTQDECFDNGAGATQRSTGAQNECFNLLGVKSVLLYC